MSGLTGHLRLVCAVDSRGRSALREQSFSAPFHLSKPHWEENTLILNVVNPTPGFFAGDRVTSEISVQPGAALLITTPSASRAHRAREGTVEVRQRFEIAAGAQFENLPEIFIPQAGARYRQSSTVEITEGATVFYWEMIAPGRVASGEVFEFAELDWETDIVFGGRPAVRERYHLSKGGASVRALQAQFPTAYYASVFVFSPELTSHSPCWDAIHTLHEGEAWVGCSPIAVGGYVAKIVASGSILLRRKAGAIRKLLYEAIDKPIPSLRRTTPIC